MRERCNYMGIERLYNNRTGVIVERFVGKVCVGTYTVESVSLGEERKRSKSKPAPTQ